MIFVTKLDYEKSLLKRKLLAHELAHVRQRHSLDLILVELLSILFWFSPLLKLYRRAIQTYHEFLADGAVNQRFENIPAYQNLLLDKGGMRLESLDEQPFKLFLNQTEINHDVQTEFPD